MKYEHLAHVAFNVKNMEKALQFYCEGLGMEHAYTVFYDDIYARLKEDGAPEEALARIMLMMGKPWHAYLKVADGQFLELFYTYHEEPLPGDLSDKCGYQHLCLQVADIQEAWDELVSRGIEPTSAIRRGIDRSYQFWVADPDGNRIEIMQYTPESHQLNY